MKPSWCIAAAACAAACDDSAAVDPPSDDVIAPRLVSSEPAQGAVDVYPARLADGMAPRVRIALVFDEPMDPDRATIAWGPAGGAQQPLTGVWSEDRTELVLDITGSPLAGQRPLADRTVYELDLGALGDRGGNRVDPGDGGTLRFTTGEYDALLNHSCGHVFFGPYATATASAAPSAASPRTDVAHTRYTVSLPAAGEAFAGATRLRAASAGTWHLFLDGDPGVALEAESGEVPPVEIARTPDACPGITHRATFHVAALDERFLVFGPARAGSVKFIVEVVPDM